MARLPRPHMSLSVKLAACLDALGFAPDAEIEWDHVFALGLRERTPDGGYIPDANDPRYIRPRLKEDHAVKTRGNGATTAGSDVHVIAKVKRLSKAEEEFRWRLTSYDHRTTTAKPKRKIQSRGFEKRPANGWR